MKIIMTYLLLLTSFVLSGQTSNDTIAQAHSVATKYLTLMYSDRDFDAASKMLNANGLLEMQDFYIKRKEVTLTDTALTGQIKRDFTRLYAKTRNYQIIEIVNSNLSSENGMTFYSLTYKFAETFDNIEKASGSMIVLVSNDNGQTWTILDYRIKAVCDRVAKGEL